MTDTSGPGFHPFASAAGFLRDVRHALRLLRGRAGFAGIAIATLALAIGANTAIFSVVRAVLLEPIPFADPERLVLVWEASDRNAEDRYIVSAPNFLDWQRGVRSFESSAIWEMLSFNLSGEGDAERVSGMRVSSSAFALLGVSPQLGRTFTADEDRQGHDVAVISDALWRRRFGRRADIVGQTTRINGRPFQIIGVMPPTFRFTQRETGVWTPIAFTPGDAERDAHSFFAAARLREGVTIAAARQELDALGRSLAKQYPVENKGETATLTPMDELGVTDLQPTLIALSGAVILVLAIACVNVANLLLAQASSRRQEFAVRAALGASRWRMARQLLAEGLVIALAAGLLGLVVAWVGTSLIAGVLPASIVYAPFRDAGNGIRIDASVLGFTMAISMLTGVLFSLAPIMGRTHTVPAVDLKSAGNRSTTGRLTSIRAVLVAAEVALAMIVLTAAGLMIKSITRLVSVDPGLQPRNVLVLWMTLPQPNVYGPPVRQRYCSDVTERVSAIPGVLSTGAISHLPLSGANAGRGFAIEGRTFPPGENASASYRLTCPGYFKTLGIPLLEGRDFDARDSTDAPGVVILNEETAKLYWPNQHAVGQRIKLGRTDSDTPWMTVVGVAANVRHFGLDNAARREMFRPYSQAVWPVMTVVVKTASDPGEFTTSVRSALQRIDPDVPISRVTTMEAVERDSTGSRRFPMMLLGAFGFVALTLAIVGVYGVVNYIVTQRTREIGIRMALGARGAQVLQLVVAGSLGPVVTGLAIGGAGAFFAARLLGTLLFNVQPGDPVVLAGIAAMLGASALAASLVPARRAALVDPIRVLKED
jgi:putative ABC transport system permease protein